MNIRLIISGLLWYSLLPGMIRAEIIPDTVHVQDSVIKDKKFMKDVWKKVQKVNQEYRQYKMEKPQPVAGVRGKAHDESLSQEMYYKGGERYPQRYEVEQAVEMMKGMMADTSLEYDKQAEVTFYLGQCYLQLQDHTQAALCFRKVVGEYPKNRYAQNSRQLLKQLESK